MQQMATLFRELCEEGAEQGVYINVCFTSRHYPALDIPTELQLVLEDLDEHQKDLSKYVRSQKFTSGSAGNLRNIPGQVQSSILEKANGVFLWVVLVTGILKEEYLNGTVHTVKERLRQIPQDLTALFRSIVQRDQENLDQLVLCLRWILYCERPLELRDFYFAMMAGIDGQSLEWNPGCEEDLMHNFLRSRFKGLAELTRGKNGRVQFIHESVRDFLIKRNGSDSIESICSTSAHEGLKQCCIRGIQIDIDTCWQTMLLTKAINQDVTTWRPSHRRDERALLNNHFPFLCYASQMVFSHADKALPKIPLEDFIDHF
jgi:hypothetical protein